MPTIGRFPCESCEYVATNRRMLSRHVVVAHSDKVYQCPLCPFITRYAANWYRHKRSLHGVRKSTTCEVCGFFANSVEDLNQHIEVEHPQHLQLRRLQQEYALEKELLGAGPATNVSASYSSDGSNREVNNLAFVNGINNSQCDGFNKNVVTDDDSVKFSLPLNGNFFINDSHLPGDQGLTVNLTSPPKMDLNGQDYSNLSPPKVRRSYCCDLCGLLTSNPREFLYHQRDVHNMRVNVFECKLCIYASKHVQKLQRHYGLVHRQRMLPDEKAAAQVQKPIKAKKAEKKPLYNSQSTPPVVPANPISAYEFPDDEPEIVPKPVKKANKVKMLKCATCNYQTRNKFLLAHHEKTVHLKKKFFKCAQCGYVTNEKARYTKHMKYHNLPKMQCEFCHFKSAYKWNMERHLKNHSMAGEGQYNCTVCTFVTHSKQSLKMHVINHHRPEESFIDEKEDDSFLDLPMDGNNGLDNVTFEYDGIDPQNLYPPIEEKSNMVWNDEQEPPKMLRCTTCDFQTKWSFELRKHEESHKSPKRHSCPLCGMGFEHIAWLTKHLNRIHKEDAEAKNLAAAYELMKPKRRRYGKQAAKVVPKLTDSVKQTYQPNEKQSVLSTLLRSTAPSKYVSILPKGDLPNFNIAATEQVLSEDVEKFKKPPSTAPKKYSRKSTNCRICGYRTKWISELEKHMRVHSNDKPFQCSRCSYHSKWKGDLTRHMVKHHGVKINLGNKKIPVPKIRLRKTLLNNKLIATNRWQTVKQEPISAAIPSTASENKEQDSPLDLTIGNIFQPHRAPRFEDNNDNGQIMNYSIDNDLCDLQNEFIHSDPKDSSRITSNESLEDENEAPLNVYGKRKYFCPFCSFTTSTPSRFHVHIVQHYNKKPFMCSVCNHRSNWEWDITKHIRLRGCKDKQHNSACVLLTDETGRRNYEKYDKYLKKEKKVAPKVTKRRDSPRRRGPPLAAGRKSPAKSQSNEMPSVSTTTDDDPENIVVTPDISFAAADDGMDITNNMDFDSGFVVDHSSEVLGSGFKFYLCKHCNYRHSSRKLVISHLSVHAGIKPYRCRVCGLTANWRHIIVRHVKATHNGYMNDVEDRITYAQEGFVIRITSVKTGAKSSDVAVSNKKSQYTCKFCPYKCDKEVYIKFHMKQHKPREGAIYQCTFCPYYVKFKKTLVRHLKLHDPPSPTISTPYTEDALQGNMSFMTTEQDFINAANGEDDYSTGQMSFYEEDSITVNYDRLKAETIAAPDTPIKLKRHICDHCPYRTDNRTQYLYHKQFHRPNSSAPFKCSVCTYWASMQHLLTQHMKVHQQDDFLARYGNDSYNDECDVPKAGDGGEIPMVLVQRGGISTKMFQCRFCPMTNKKRANVKVHERMHSSTKQSIGKYTCSLCNYKCLGQGSLTNHMKMHLSPEAYLVKQVAESDGSKKKVFSHFCAKCPAVFKNSSDLFVHRTFHGANLPYACTSCDYRAKHKPHLQKHLQVHTIAYVSKRNASYGPSIPPTGDNALEFLESDPCGTPVFVKKIDQMLLLEAAEVKMFLQRGIEFAEKMMQKCPSCPAYFAKTAILTYHRSLHGSAGEFTCSQCDYATVRSENLAIHSQVHPKDIIIKRPQKVFDCPKCPATFYKADRYDRHYNLHGKNSRYVCDQCDYSVRFAANLSKHKMVHVNGRRTTSESDDNILTPVVHQTKSTSEISYDDNFKSPENDFKSPEDNFKNPEDYFKSPDDNFKSPEDNFKSPEDNFKSPEDNSKNPEDNFKSPESGEDKKVYVCDRCPYYHGRKDAVQSHQHRHEQKDGYECPYCDYRSMGPSFLRDHVKIHIQPNNLYLPEAFMTEGPFKIWVVKDGSKELLFEDKGANAIICDRFYPVLKSRELLAPSNKNVTDPDEDDISEETANESSVVKENSVFLKPAPVDKKTKDSGNEENKPRLLPKVVLKDIFSTGKLKQLDNGSVLVNSLEMDPEKTLTANPDQIETTTVDTSMEKQSTQNLPNGICEKNAAKSSIIVKIKVESIVEDNNERSLYTISSKKNSKADTGSDAASDVTIPADDLDDLLPESELQCDDAETIGSETAEDILSTAGIDADFSNMAFKDSEPFCDTNFTGCSNGTTSDKDSTFQQNGTDFLKQLDFMVNNVSTNISSLKVDELSANLQSPLMF